MTQGLVQVVMSEGTRKLFEQWLADQGLRLFSIPVEGDDLPSYGVGRP